MSKLLFKLFHFLTTRDETNNMIDETQTFDFRICLSSPLNLPWAQVENFYLFYFIFYGIDREIILISL